VSHPFGFRSSVAIQSGSSVLDSLRGGRGRRVVQPLLEGEASGAGTHRPGRRPGRRAGAAVTSVLYETREKKRVRAG
jgi:hypothetical protein